MNSFSTCIIKRKICFTRPLVIMDKEKCHFFVKEDSTADRLREVCYKSHNSNKKLGYRVVKEKIIYNLFFSFVLAYPVY